MKSNQDPEVATTDLQIEIRSTCSLETARSVTAIFASSLAPLVDELSVAAIRLAIAEATTNLARHGCAGGPLYARLSLRGNEVQMTLADRGEPFDPRRFKRPDFDPMDVNSLPTHGMGLALIHDTMDTVDYVSRDGENFMTLEKRVERQSTTSHVTVVTNREIERTK